MALSARNNFEVKPLPILGPYNVQRFKQWSPEDTANWYLVKEEKAKKPLAMFPCMGRSHINYLGVNQLIFGSEPRGLFKSINFSYIVVGNDIFRVDSNYNEVDISG